MERTPNDGSISEHLLGGDALAPGAHEGTHDENLGVVAVGDLLRARARRMAIWGSVLLFVVTPFALGGWITVAVHLVDDGHRGGLALAGMIAWAVVCFIVLLLGFCLVLGGVYLWWRSRNPRTATMRHTRDDDRAAARAVVLQEMRESIRQERGSEGEPVDDGGSASGAVADPGAARRRPGTAGGGRDEAVSAREAHDSDGGREGR